MTPAPTLAGCAVYVRCVHCSRLLPADEYLDHYDPSRKDRHADPRRN